MKSTIFFVLFIFFISACKKENLATDNASIYQLLWTDFDENYAGFAARNVDWDSVYQIYYPLAQNSSSEEELWKICIETLDVLYDAHVYIVGYNGNGFESGSLYENPNIVNEFDISVAESYLENIRPASEKNETMYSANIKNKNLGYIRINNFGRDGSAWENNIEILVDELQNSDGIIIDIRNNPGGEDVVSQKIAGAFNATDELAYFKKTKNGPGHNDFDEPIAYYSESYGAMQFTKPVVVLINSYSASAAEVFSLYMETQNHVQFIGIPTAKAFSDVSFERYLPNGWIYVLSHQLYYYENGNSPEGVGILPDIEVRNDPADVANGIDEVLETAIDYF